MSADLGVKPSAILMISGHWEDREFAVTTSPAPPMIYDYSGFPEHTYRIQYAAPGSPELAQKIEALLNVAGLAAHGDPKRGFDHGMYAPLAVAYPAADVPVVQLSLRADYDPETHVRVGRALAPLRAEGVLIVASGLSYHNLGLFGPRASKPSREFDDWLQETLLKSPSPLRTTRLLSWAHAPSARIAHPEEDHLLPLMVAVGAAESEAATMVYHEDDFFGGIVVSSFRFG